MSGDHNLVTGACQMFIQAQLFILFSLGIVIVLGCIVY